MVMMKRRMQSKPDNIKRQLEGLIDELESLINMFCSWQIQGSFSLCSLHRGNWDQHYWRGAQLFLLFLLSIGISDMWAIRKGEVALLVTKTIIEYDSSIIWYLSCQVQIHDDCLHSLKQKVWSVCDQDLYRDYSPYIHLLLFHLLAKQGPNSHNGEQSFFTSH